MYNDGYSELYHHGVKGMKWDESKKKHHGDEEDIKKKMLSKVNLLDLATNPDKFYSDVSRVAKEDILSDPQYDSYGLSDKEKSIMADNVVSTMRAKVDVKKAIKDPEGYANSLEADVETEIEKEYDKILKNREKRSNKLKTYQPQTPKGAYNERENMRMALKANPNRTTREARRAKRLAAARMVSPERVRQAGYLERNKIATPGEKREQKRARRLQLAQMRVQHGGTDMYDNNYEELYHYGIKGMKWKNHDYVEPERPSGLLNGDRMRKINMIKRGASTDESAQMQRAMADPNRAARQRKLVQIKRDYQTPETGRMNAAMDRNPNHTTSENARQKRLTAAKKGYKNNETKRMQVATRFPEKRKLDAQAKKRATSKDAYRVDENKRKDAAMARQKALAGGPNKELKRKTDAAGYRSAENEFRKKAVKENPNRVYEQVVNNGNAQYGYNAQSIQARRKTKAVDSAASRSNQRMSSNNQYSTAYEGERKRIRKSAGASQNAQARNARGR